MTKIQIPEEKNEIVDINLIRKVIDETFCLTTDAFEGTKEITIPIYLRTLYLNFVDVLERTPESLSLSTLIKFNIISILELNKLTHQKDNINDYMNIKNVIYGIINDLCTFQNGPLLVADATAEILNGCKEMIEKMHKRGEKL